MVEGYVSPAGVHFLPHDVDGADRALMAGRSLAELDDSLLGGALAGLARAVTGTGVPGGGRRRRFRSRKAGRAR